jgi:cytochrome c peroxidase
MHDGSVPTLEAAVAHYASGGKGPLRAEQLTGFTLSTTETSDLIAFLTSLTDTTFVTNPAFSDPHQ